MTEKQKEITWQAHEHEHREKNSDWFWVLGIIAVAAAVTAAIFENLLFSIVILVAAFTMALFAAKPPELITFVATARGIRVDATLYPYQNLESFWISDGEEVREPRLLLKSQRVLMPLLVIPIQEIPPEELREFLAKFLNEEELYEPVSQRILEFFGF